MLWGADCPSMRPPFRFDGLLHGALRLPMIEPSAPKLEVREGGLSSELRRLAVADAAADDKLERRCLSDS